MKPDLEKTVGQWSYICCEVGIHTGGGVSVDITKECDACGNTNLRFTHTLENREDKKQISVGIECAGILMNDWDLPRLAENEVQRKEKWRIRYRKPGRCFATIADLVERGKL